MWPTVITTICKRFWRGLSRPRPLAPRPSPLASRGLWPKSYGTGHVNGTNSSGNGTSTNTLSTGGLIVATVHTNMPGHTSIHLSTHMSTYMPMHMSMRMS